MGRRQTRPSVSAEQPSILVLNVGSSTLKFALFPVADSDDAVLRGVLEYSGLESGRIRITGARGRQEDSRPSTVTRTSAATELLEYLKANSLFASIQSIGHRLVHGGPRFREPVRIDPDVRASLDQVIPLAPDHLPIELSAIDEVSRVAPVLPQVACFDTAFHSSLPTVARLFGLPRSLADSGVVRYGFHGLSYEYVTDTLRRRGELPRRTVVAHLGNGASITALLDGVSVDTSMGLTPTGGVLMGTRSGDLDPGVLLYLLRSRGFSAVALDDAVNHRGGLLGISESSSDVRRLLATAPTDSKADDALGVFGYQVKKVIGGYAAALGGIDALVFTGGIGEHSPEMRQRICGGLEFLGIELDPTRNRENAATISTAGSSTVLRIVKTDEEAMIARHTRRLMG
jgi:acetate kinase